MDIPQAINAMPRRLLLAGAGAFVTMAGLGRHDAVKASSMADANPDAMSGLVRLGRYYRQKGAEPMIDVTINPGFGVAGLTGEVAILRNLRIAQFLVTAQNEFRKRGWLYWPTELDGVAPDAKLSMLSYTSAPRLPFPLTPTTGDQHSIPYTVLEFVAVFNIFPDFHVVPGSFVALPFAGGVQFTNDYAATSSRTGRTVRFWETDTLLIDDNGRIRDWIIGTDSQCAIIFEETYGIPMTAIDFATFPDLLRRTITAQGGIPSWVKRPSRMAGDGGAYRSDNEVRR